ncbi:MAG TPA: polyprenyl diphosphate synthase [Gemmatales bacterium]|nr:polyprenyl diphosphate synthase [Gemmatales bacterium]HMP59916.1 polyprenyl diphosphate synthase [Gemmatales bacterium]
MARQQPYTEAELARLGLSRDQLPRHVAVIMDGNGRWARQQGLPRIEGHRRGVASVRATIEECCRLDLQQLTLYCLSVENWKRPKQELEFLMLLLEQYLVEERAEIMEQNIRFASIGRREGLPAEVLKELDQNVALSASNTGLTLCLAINYGGRTEIVDAARDLVASGISPEEVTEERFAEHLYTAGMPDPDLLIRTAGELRVSNFLLWQISYAELWVTPRTWPEFDADVLRSALADYARRERRFGGLLDPAYPGGDRDDGEA